jgi:hypothetical protein
MLFPFNKPNVEEIFTYDGKNLFIPDVPSPICPKLLIFLILINFL